jgi:hypothetical protein
MPNGNPPRDIQLMFHLFFECTTDAVWLFCLDTVTVVDCNEVAVTPASQKHS